MYLDLMEMMANEYGQQKAVGDVIREIGAQAGAAQDTTAAKAFAAFLPGKISEFPTVKSNFIFSFSISLKNRIDSSFASHCYAKCFITHDASRQ